jgi:hypothetical protein
MLGLEMDEMQPALGSVAPITKAIRKRLVTSRPQFCLGGRRPFRAGALNSIKNNGDRHANASVRERSSP